MRPRRIGWDGSDPAALAGELRAAARPDPAIAERVAEIIDAVRAGGDEAVRELAERFEPGGAPAAGGRVAPDRIARALDTASPALRGALELAARNVEAAAAATVPAREAGTELPEGQRIELLREPVGAAAAYVPGGRAAYPSSVVMCCVPARLAGVPRLVVCSPPGPDGEPHGAVLAAAAIVGVDEVYALGGAQAIAALALGTGCVAAVDVIAGPGGAYVTEAKRQLFGEVGIDGLAGPSELMVVAGPGARPREIALDLLSQAEHGPDSLVAVACADPAWLDEVAELASELAGHRPSVADAPLTLIDAPDVDRALALADAFAPEHLQLAFDEAGSVARGRTAGCVFCGPDAATAFGDYVAGSNHVLPTGGGARYAGPLEPATFMRRMSIVSMGPGTAASLAPPLEELARTEGMPVHGESARARGAGEGR